MMRRVVLFGGPGAGKGTQATRLAGALTVPVVATGDLFRGHIRDRTALGDRVSALIARGDLVSDAITSEMIANRLETEDAADGFVLDGYPRTVGQLQELDRMMGALGTDLDGVLLLEVADEELEERLLVRANEQGRPDDTPAVIRHRIDLYHRETEPLAAEYDSRGLLFRLDGTGTTDAVHRRLLAIGSESLTNSTSALPGQPA